MANDLASFAIHADNVNRCRRFYYEAVFGWRFEPWDPPHFYLAHAGDQANPGVQGLMHRRQEPRGVSGPNCFEIIRHPRVSATWLEWHLGYGGFIATSGDGYPSGSIPAVATEKDRWMDFTSWYSRMPKMPLVWKPGDGANVRNRQYIAEKTT